VEAALRACEAEKRALPIARQIQNDGSNKVFVPSLSLFSPLGASFFGCFRPCWFFQMHFPSFWVVVALYVAWVSFTWVYYMLEPSFFKKIKAVQCNKATGPHFISHFPALRLAGHLEGLKKRQWQFQAAGQQRLLGVE
jgi:hypothetical protein